MTRCFFLVLCGATFASAASAAPPPPRKASVTSIQPSELAEFETLPQKTRELITAALRLTERNLTYTYASADPDRGGMDCSGTIHHLLRAAGFPDVPRQSDHICGWVIENATFVRTQDVHSFDHEAFEALKPGDLVFWSGTYNAGTRKIPVTHVMLYLGKRASDGKPVIFGASDGRSYEGQRRCGVSVFDFKVPSAKSTSSLYGFGAIPGLRSGKDKAGPKEEIRKAQLPERR